MGIEKAIGFATMTSGVEVKITFAKGCDPTKEVTVDVKLSWVQLVVKDKYLNPRSS